MLPIRALSCRIELLMRINLKINPAKEEECHRVKYLVVKTTKESEK